MKFWNKYFPKLTKEEQDKLFVEAVKEAEENKLHKGVKELLSELHSKGVKLFIVSSDPSERITKGIEKEGIPDFFDEVHSEVYVKAPVIRKIVKKFNLDPAQTLYVGDTCGDVEAGKEAGVKTAGITWGIQHEDLVKESNPDYLISDMCDLLELIKE
jgi:HAD superfamily hydrolase (TIGR01549 family)